MLACRTCQERFSERKGTPLFHCKLPEDKAVSVLQHLQEDCGVRQTARLVGVNKDTVIRLAAVAGQHAQEVHEELVAFSPLRLVRSNSTRSGPSSARKRSTATPPTRRMNNRETTGIMWPLTRNTVWW